MFPILTYHSLDRSGSVISIAPRRFAEQMACIARCGWRGVSLRDAVAYQQRHGTWPEQQVVLTFDDGYRNFYDLAFPILTHYGFGATVFLVSGHMGSVNDWAPPPDGLGLQPILSWPQALELATAGIELGAHAQGHRDLCQLDASAAYAEILTSRQEIEQHLGQAVDSFAYPFGNLTTTAASVVQQHFRAACTTVLKRVAAEPLHLLPRVDMYYVRTLSALQRLLAGKLDLYLTYRRYGRLLRRVLPLHA